MHTALCTLLKLHSAHYKLGHTLHSALFTMHTALCTLDTALWSHTLRSALCSMHSALWTCTLYSGTHCTLYTLAHYYRVITFQCPVPEPRVQSAECSVPVYQCSRMQVYSAKSRVQCTQVKCPECAVCRVQSLYECPECVPECRVCPSVP